MIDENDPGFQLAQSLYMEAAKYTREMIPPGTGYSAVQSTREEFIVVALCRRIVELERRLSAIDGEGMGK